MAVEARHLNLFPPQIFGNRELTMMNGVGCSSIGNTCSNYGTLFTAVEMMLPNASAANDAVTLKNAPLQSDSGLTYAAAVPATRKRSRELVAVDGDQLIPILNVQNHRHNEAVALDRCGGSYTFLGEDIASNLLQHQSDIDRFVAQHNERLRFEIHERQKRHTRGFIATVDETVTKKLKAREEEIDRIGKLNNLLEERVKSLYIENQIWRDVAQSNEAAANALRSNLEQVLAQVHHHHEPLADDAQSCCGSSSSSNHHRKDDEITSRSKDRNHAVDNRMCRSCGGDESSVLILPCRHLCVCTACSSTVHACPVCHSTKTRILHVNLSS